MQESQVYSDGRRLRALEKQNRLLRTLILALLAVPTLVLGLLGADSDSTVRTDRIELPGKVLTFATSDGKELAKLELRDHGPALWIYDRQGDLAANVGGSNRGGGYLSVSRPGSEPGIYMSGNSISVMGERVDGGVTSAFLATIDERGGVLRLFTLDRKLRATLGISEADAAGLTTWSGDLPPWEATAQWPATSAPEDP